ncbi:MAG: CCA tRNA nucleotidyltransferase, partial [Cytophagales bacterium]
AQNMTAYVVGGFVRDYLLGRPCTDIDILCVGDSIALAEAFARQTPGAHISIFKNFGTAMVTWKNLQVEFVYARKESYQKHSRKPQVSPGTLEDDIFRRDFTINTLAIALNGPDKGIWLDLCGGIKDLEKDLIRTPLDPDKTFSDDPLRMFRAVRFATQLSFTLEEQTITSIQKEAHRISILSKERIITELNKILCTPKPAEGLLLLDKVGLLKLVIPEMEKLKGAETIQGQSHKDNFIHTLQVVNNVAKSLAGKSHPKRLWLIWAAMLHDIAKPATKQFHPKTGFTFHGHEVLGVKISTIIFRRLGLPMQQERRYVNKLIRMHLRHIPLVENDVTDAAVRRFIYDAGEELEDLILLCRADITSKNQRKVAGYLANFEKLASKITAIEEKDRIRNMKPVITGDTIMQAFDLKPCRVIGTLKKAIKDAILSGEIPNQYPEAYSYMLSYARNMGLSPKKS